MGTSKISNNVERQMLRDAFITKGSMGKGSLTSKNFNDYILSGTYVNNGTNDFSNRPGSGADNGILIVHTIENTGVQIWIGTYFPYFAFRTVKNGVFSAWINFKQI